jgi:hypothetical protein
MDQVFPDSQERIIKGWLGEQAQTTGSPEGPRFIGSDAVVHYTTQPAFNYLRISDIGLSSLLQTKYPISSLQAVAYLVS